MLKVQYNNQFKKDYKIIQKRGYDINKLKEIVKLLESQQKLPNKYQEHYLIGRYKRF